MSTARHIITFLESLRDGDEQKLYSAALQAAAQEARLGHSKIALEIKELVDQAKAHASIFERKSSGPVPLVQPKGDLASLIAVRYSDLKFSDLIFTSEIQAQLKRIVTEQRQQECLRKYNLEPRRKILIVGPFGTGRTTIAATLAGELHLPLLNVLYKTLLFSSESSNKLKSIFDAISSTKGVYLFDDLENINTEICDTHTTQKRNYFLNSILQLVQNDHSSSIIVAVTSQIESFEKALIRSFDDIIECRLPTGDLIRQLIKSRLITFSLGWSDWSKIVEMSTGLNYSDIIRATDEAAKIAVLTDRNQISEDDLLLAIVERKKAYEGILS